MRRRARRARRARGASRACGARGRSVRIGRERYAQLYGPTVGDQVRLADTDLWIEVERDDCIGGDEAVFGGGKTIRESMLQGTTTRAEGAPDLVITNAVVLDHWGVVKCDVGIRDGRIVALGKAGNPDIADGVHPRSADRAVDGDPRRRGPHPHRGRRRLPRPLHRAADRRRGARLRDHDADRRRHRPGRGHEGDDRARRARTRSRRCSPRSTTSPVNVLLLGKGNTVSAEALHEQVRRRRRRVQAARGLGLDAGRDRRVPARRRRDGRAGRDPHRHAQRGRLPRVDGRGDRRPDDPRVPHRGRGRRPRAGHHPHRVVPERAAVVDEPDAPAHGQHRRRAPRHADGLPPPQPARARGPRVRREPHPRAPRSPPRTCCTTSGAISIIGSDSQAMGRAGETIVRTWQTAHAMKARLGAGRARRQRARAALRRQVHDLPGGRARDRPRGRLGRGRQARRPRALGSALLRRAPARRGEGRHDRLGADRRPERVDPDAAAGARPADVRGLGARGGRGVARVRRAGSARSRPRRAARPAAADGRGRRHALRSARPTCRRTRRLPEIRVEPDTFRVWVDGDEIEPAPAAVLPMAQRYFLF